MELKLEAASGQDRWTAERRALSHQADHLSGQIGALREQTGAYPETWQRELDSELGPLRTRLERLEAALDTLRDDRHARQTKLEDETVRLHERQSAADGQLTHLSGAVDELRRETTAAGRSLEQAQPVLAALERARLHLEANTQVLARRTTTLEGLVHDLPGEWRAEFDRQVEALQGLGSALDAVSGQVQAQARQTTALHARLGELDRSCKEGQGALERKMRGMIEAGITRIRDEHSAQVGQLRDDLASLRETSTSTERALKEELGAAAARNRKLETRLQAQQDVLKELERRTQADGNRLARFLAWFGSAGAMGRMRGKPE